MSSDKPGRIVFIGNIPYGLTEEQIIAICSSVGTVLSFRLVYDQDTGRPKGFGFAEFADTDAAASAVRNLDKHQIMGRELRVDFSHVGGKDDSAPANYAPQPIPASQPSTNGYAPLPPPQSTSTLGPLPPGTDLPPNLTAPDSISKTLSSLPAPQLLDILSQMKGLVVADPAKATELLRQAPQLSYAIFQALLLMGLVDTSVLASVVEQAAPPPPQPPAASLPPRPPPQVYAPPPALPVVQPQQQAYPGYASVPTPPVQPVYQPPPPPQPQPAQVVPQVQPSQEELLKQVLEMPQAAVDQLSPGERAQIMVLKQQFGGRIGY